MKVVLTSCVDVVTACLVLSACYTQARDLNQLYARVACWYMSETRNGILANPLRQFIYIAKDAVASVSRSACAHEK